MNAANDKDNQATKQIHLGANTSQFDLSTAYRLLIGAYIRSTGKVRDDHNRANSPSKQTKSREIHQHEVDFDC